MLPEKMIQDENINSGNGLSTTEKKMETAAQDCRAGWERVGCDLRSTESDKK